MTRKHEIKCWPEFFQAIWDGHKTFEVRKDDRGYATGDRLLIRELDPEVKAASSAYHSDGDCLTGRSIDAEITYKLPGGKFGIDPDWCVLGIVIKETDG